MRTQTVVSLPRAALDSLACLKPGAFYTRTGQASGGTSVYIRNTEEAWLRVSVRDVKVHFTRDAPCLSIEDAGSDRPDRLLQAGLLPKFSSIDFLLQCHWERFALPGEAPIRGTRVVRGHGSSAAIPISALAVSTVLCGIVFNDAHQVPLLIITLGDVDHHAVHIETSRNAMRVLVRENDFFTHRRLRDIHGGS